MITGNEILIMTDPALSSVTGLGAIDFVAEPIKPVRVFKKGNTKEAQLMRMTKMSPRSLAVFFSKIQQPKSFRMKPPPKSKSIE